MYYALQKVDKDIKSLNVTSYDTLPLGPEINVAASTSQEPAKPSSKPDPKEVKEQKQDQEKARMQKELNKKKDQMRTVWS